MASRINADSSNGLQLVSDSSGEIQFQSSGITKATIGSNGLSSPGHVLQVVSTNKTDTFTSAANQTWTDITGMSVSITPSSASNKIIIIVSMFGVFWQTGYNGCILSLLRNSTFIGGGASSGSRSSVIGTQGMTNQSGGTKIDSGVQYHVTYIDSPSTTSAITYKMQFWQDTPAHPIYVNRTNNDSDAAAWSRTSSSIIAMEIAG
jgi:hypothetical protein